VPAENDPRTGGSSTPHRRLSTQWLSRALDSLDAMTLTPEPPVDELGSITLQGK